MFPSSPLTTVYGDPERPGSLRVEPIKHRMLLVRLTLGYHKCLNRVTLVKCRTLLPNPALLTPNPPNPVLFSLHMCSKVDIQRRFNS